MALERDCLKNTNSDESFKKLVHYNDVIYKLSMAYYMKIRSFYSIYLWFDFNLLQEKYSDGEDVIEAIKEQVLEVEQAIADFKKTNRITKR